VVVVAAQELLVITVESAGRSQPGAFRQVFVLSRKSTSDPLV
jgi:hypothetical protein